MTDITLNVRNLSAVIDDPAPAFRVLLEQVNNDLHLHWRDVPFVERIVEYRDARWPQPKDGMWRATIYDYPSQALGSDDLAYIPVSALSGIGYHFVDGADGHGLGVPHLVVFAANGQQVGVPWTMTLSHELLEALADPTGTELCNEYEMEICDPVQAQAYPLEDKETLKTFWVSNFVTPAWFEDPIPPLDAREKQIRYDFAGQLVSARQRSLGGQRTLKIEGRDLSEVLTRFGSMVSAGE